MAPGERRALIERILPHCGEQGARVLSLETEADRAAAPVAIVAAFDGDEITWNEAEDLLGQVESTVPSKQAEQAPTVDWVEWNAKFLRGLVEGPRKYWGMEPDEEF